MGGKIMVKVVTGFVIIIIITIIIAVNWAIKMSKAEHGDNPIILQSKEINPKKALVIYQPSLTKASYIVAHSIAQGLNDSGLEATINYPGKHLSSDVSHYSVIAFGGPVYGGSVPKALIDYIERIEGFSNQRIVLFSTAGRGQPHLRPLHPGRQPLGNADGGGDLHVHGPERSGRHSLSFCGAKEPLHIESQRHSGVGKQDPGLNDGGSRVSHFGRADDVLAQGWPVSLGRWPRHGGDSKLD